MKKITLLFVAMVFGSLTAFAQFTFPAEGPFTVVSDNGPTVVNINDAGNIAGVTAGTYASFTVTADWEVGAGNPWSVEADLTITTLAGSVTIDPPTAGGANNGANAALEFSGDLAGLYDPAVDGSLDIALNQSFGGSDAQWSNVTVTLFPPPVCGVAENVATDNLLDVSSDFTWDAPAFGTPTGYNWEIQPDGVAQGGGAPIASGTTMGTMASSGAVLTADTAYEFYVQTDCGPDGTANYVTIGFTTLTGPPPANDDFANAIAVSCGDLNIVGDTTNASRDEETAPDFGSADNDGLNVWYFYDTAVEGPGDVTLDLCPSAYDTSVIVYTGTSGALTAVAGNDDGTEAVCGVGQGTRSLVTFTATGTNIYYIMIEGWNIGSFGMYDLSVTCVASSPPPANDLCGNAEELTLTVTANGTTVGATQTAGEEQPTCDAFGTIADVWYSVDLTGGSSDLSIVTTITGTSDQANVAVYSACGGLEVDQLGCSDESGGEALTVPGLAAGTYYIRVWSDGAAPPSSGSNNRIEGTFTITADATLSVNSVENENAFTYYPNPVKDELVLSAQKDIQNVSVFNVLGQEVLRTAPNTVENTIDMNALSQGAYFVKVTIGNVTETIRIIKE